jgi:hypothetical protein
VAPLLLAGFLHSLHDRVHFHDGGPAGRNAAASQQNRGRGGQRRDGLGDAPGPEGGEHNAEKRGAPADQQKEPERVSQ